MVGDNEKAAIAKEKDEDNETIARILVATDKEERPTRPKEPTTEPCMDAWDRRQQEANWDIFNEKMGKYVSNLRKYQTKYGVNEEEQAIYNLIEGVTYDKLGIPIDPYFLPQYLKVDKSSTEYLQAKERYFKAKEGYNKWNKEDKEYDRMRIKEIHRKKKQDMHDLGLTTLDLSYLAKGSISDKLTENTWLGDTGATCHMAVSTDGLYDTEEVSDRFIEVGGKKKIQVIAKGKKNIIIQQKTGEQVEITLSDVLIAPELGFNLISLTRAFSVSGFKLTGDEKGLHLQKRNIAFTFDRVIKSGNGFVLGVEALTAPSKEGNASVAIAKGTRMSYKKFHGLMGHIGEERVRATAQKLEITLTGKTEACEDCAIAKARQANLNKETKNHSSTPGERLGFDISSVKGESYGGARFWLLVVDDATDRCWSMFLKKKSELSKHMIGLLRKLKKEGFDVKYLRCDNAGENLAFQKDLEQCNDLDIEFEYTAPGTPQQNGKVERKFATLYGRARSMLNGAKVIKTLRNRLWAECAKTATDLENVSVSPRDKLNALNRFYKTKDDPKWVRYLRTFGEICVATDRSDTKIRGKLEDRGHFCMFLGYSNDHAGNVYRLLKLKTNKVIMSRDITWLNKNWGTWKGLTKITETHSNDFDEEDYKITRAIVNPTMTENEELEDENSVILMDDESEDTEPETMDPEGNTEAPTRGGSRLEGELKRLRTFYNDTLAQHETADVALISLMSGGRDPLTFDEAWDHLDPQERKMWRAAITKEFNDMKKRGVWRIISRTDVPTDRRLIGHKWVFKKKRNGVYRARLVALGYSQIPGVDFSENFSPVVDDITFRVALIYATLHDLGVELIDIETAFLYGDLIEEIYMSIPEGLEHFEDIPDNSCTKLEATIYGLVQSARMFWKKLMKCLTEKLDFEQSKADPCLLIREDKELGTCLFCTYVDDVAIIGSNKARKYVKTEIKKYFNTKETEEMTDYLGVEVTRDPEGWILRQDDIIAGLEKYFKEDADTIKRCTVPLAPGSTIIRVKDPTEAVEPILQSKYRSGVGSLNYLVKHTRPEISNSVRELSKALGMATKAHLKDMYRVIKYVLETRERGLRLKPKKLGKWVIEAYCDSDFAGDRDTRRSVTGYAIYLNGTLIAWKSRSQKNVTLSSTEAEYVAISEACTAIMYVVHLLKSINCKIEFPITLHVDNMGAIFLANNASTSRTRHIDTRYHYVRELTEESNPTIKIVYCKSSENKADIYTKNVAQDTLNGHIDGLFEKLTKHETSLVKDKNGADYVTGGTEGRVSKGSYVQSPHDASATENLWD
jgi:hypothetical protein